MPYKRVRYNDDMLRYCKMNAQKTIAIIDSVLDGTTSLGRAAYDAGFNAVGFRKGLKVLETMADPVPNEFPADVAAYKTPEEMFYADVFCFNGDDYDDLWEVIPMDSEAVMNWVYEGAGGVLREREGEMLKDRYGGGLTLEEISKKYGITRERVRQLLSRSIRKMRRKTIKQILRVGMEKYNEAMEEYRLQKQEIIRGLVDEELRADMDIKRAEESAGCSASFDDEIGSIMDVSIDDLGLSVRSYNCLMRAGLKTVGSLAEIQDAESLFMLRNLGRRSFVEIVRKLEELGVKCPLTNGVF